MNLADLAAHLGATLQGDPAVNITGVAAIDTAGPGEVTFVSNPKYIALASTTKAGAVLVEPNFPEIAAATLRLANPYLAFARAIELFYQAPVLSGGDPSDGGDRADCEDWGRCAYWGLCGDLRSRYGGG